jgi:Tol biopolymer transport system component
MNRVTGILVVGAMWLPGCEGQAPGAAGNDEAMAVAGVSAAGVAAKANGAEGQAAETVVRRVWGRRRVDLAGDVSYDGRELVFVEYPPGDLAVRDLRTGEIRKLTDKGSREESGKYSMTPKMSRDGRWVAYIRAIPDGNGERYELRIAGMDGTPPRTLYRDESVGWINAITWSPDGDYLLASVWRNGGPQQILRVSVPEGTSRILDIPAPGLVGHMRFSPDGRLLVLDRALEERSENRDIYLMAPDGSGETRIVENPANDFVLGWAPDGEHILFAGDRGGTLGAWLLPVEDGRTAGDPVLVKPDIWRMTPLDFTRDGSYYYEVDTSKRTVYVANLNPVTGEFVTTPSPVAGPANGSTRDYWPTWSPDGRFLAYQSNHDPGPADILLQSVETGETRVVDLKGAASVTPWAWTKDGRFIIGNGRSDDREEAVFKVDVFTGEARPLPNFFGVDIRVPLGLSRDEESLYYSVWLDDGAGIAVRGINGGMAKLLYRWKGYGLAQLSPDRRYIAFSEDTGEASGLLLMPASGGEPEVLVKFPPGRGAPNEMAWTPDGEHIIYRYGGEIWSVPRAGGEPRRLEWPIGEDLMAGLMLIRLSPDGRRVAFDAESGEAELWVMENFLPGH